MLARGLANNITLSACTMNWTTRKCLLLLAIKFQNAFKTYNICISLHHSIPFFRIKVIMRNYYTQKFIHLIFNGLNGGLSIPDIALSYILIQVNTNNIMHTKYVVSITLLHSPTI
jgi:hypothetical protein